MPVSVTYTVSSGVDTSLTIPNASTNTPSAVGANPTFTHAVSPVGIVIAPVSSNSNGADGPIYLLTCNVSVLPLLFTIRTESTRDSANSTSPNDNSSGTCIAGTPIPVPVNLMYTVSLGDGALLTTFKLSMYSTTALGWNRTDIVSLVSTRIVSGTDSTENTERSDNVISLTNSVALPMLVMTNDSVSDTPIGTCPKDRLSGVTTRFGIPRGVACTSSE